MNVTVLSGDENPNDALVARVVLSGSLVIDTGVSAGVKHLPGWHPYFRFCVRFDIEPEQEAADTVDAAEENVDE